MIKKIWSGISTAVVAFAAVLALLLAGARLVGLQVYTVLSGSMEPNYPVGSIIYVKKVASNTLGVGDAISFMISEDKVATHRIIEVLPDEKDPDVIRFRTKGDNNSIPDTTPVHCNNVLGKVVGSIPLLGYLSNYVQHPPGTYIALGTMLVLVLAAFLPDIIRNAKALKTEEAPAQSIEQIQIDNEKLKEELESVKRTIRQAQKAEGHENEEDP